MKNHSRKAVQALVNFAPNLSVDGYQLSDESFHLSILTASEAVGFSRTWLTKNISRGGNTFKALCETGFSGKILEVSTETQAGPRLVKLISLDDFNALILYAASQGKEKAIALNKALIDMSLRDFFRDAFGKRPLTVEEKRAVFFDNYARSLSWEDWWEIDREDKRVVEEQIAFLEGNF